LIGWCKTPPGANGWPLQTVCFFSQCVPRLGLVFISLVRSFILFSDLGHEMCLIPPPQHSRLFPALIFLQGKLGDSLISLSDFFLFFFLDLSPPCFRCMYSGFWTILPCELVLRSSLNVALRPFVMCLFFFPVAKPLHLYWTPESTPPHKPVSCSYPSRPLFRYPPLPLSPPQRHVPRYLRQYTRPFFPLIFLQNKSSALRIRLTFRFLRSFPDISSPFGRGQFSGSRPSVLGTSIFKSHDV